MSKKQTFLESFFEKGERPNNETAEDSKIANKKKAAFKQKYQESYLHYGFIAIGDSHAPSLLCIICGDRLANEAMKPSKLLRHIETKHPALTDNPLEFFERKIYEYKRQKQLLKAISSNVSALTASFFVANHIAKTKKLIGEVLILPAAKDICREHLGKAAVKNVANVPHLAITITR